MLVTFSGLDGAGKSTLIRRLTQALEKGGRKVTVLTMYDHVGVYAWLRMARDKGRKSAPDADAPSAGTVVATLRSSKAKRVALLVDLVAFQFYRVWIELIRRRVLVVDRYFYDSLADVADGKDWTYVRFFLKLTPTPSVPILIDTPPEESYKRKGEYSVEHLTRRRGLYHEIFGRVNRPFIVPNHILEETVEAVNAEVFRRAEGKS